MRSFRRWTRSVRWSISGGWSDIWTLRRWIMKLRIVWAAIALAGLVATYAWGFTGASEPTVAPVSEAQMEALCGQAAVDSKRVAREFEEQTGEPANGFSKESCLGRTKPAPSAGRP